MTAIKERPILFSAPMVRAVLEGRKTVTRRPVKALGLQWLEDFTPEYVAEAANNLCPYGKPGDRLWVRETWYCNHSEVQKGPYLQPADMQDLDQAREDGDLVYAADGLNSYEQDQPTWRPSIHMPRWASRILLEITDVRVERLQDISDEQALAEGIIPVPKTTEGSHQFWRNYHLSGDGTFCVRTPKESFKSLWCHVAGGSFPKGEAAYKASPHSWDANPWVWVVEFKPVERK
ncbi:hypothetical protein G7025_13715 [Pseudomonas lurida]|uniref:hypothetical protein n=1 Tax=Pseudomonas TaxID=286 RepID=UPI0015E43164|nr:MULTISPECIES: hypothetical protein [Pseudomonas]MBA1294416.1 hypothetical protein [Pseudomonas lurida]